VLGQAPELMEEFFAISLERRITHPCVSAVTQTARLTFLRPARTGEGVAA